VSSEVRDDEGRLLATVTSTHVMLGPAPSN
jgi:hypothetical protein